MNKRPVDWKTRAEALQRECDALKGERDHVGDANEMIRPSREAVAPVERIECVSFERGFEEATEPVWRVRVGEYCADFEAETAANNFRGAILALFDGTSSAERRVSASRRTDTSATSGGGEP